MLKTPRPTPWTGLKWLAYLFALAIETLTHLDVSDNSINAPRAGHRGLVPRKLDVSATNYDLSQKSWRSWRNSPGRLCSQQNRLVPGQCLSKVEQLQYWDLSQNQFREFPVQSATRSLVTNAVWAVGPGMLSALTHLDVSKNQLYRGQPTGPTTQLAMECPHAAFQTNLNVTPSTPPHELHASRAVPHNQLKSAPARSRNLQIKISRKDWEPDLNGCDWGKLESLAWTFPITSSRRSDDLAKMTA